MPLTKPQLNTHLGIEIDNSHTSLSPGDAVTGRVTREQQRPSTFTQENLTVHISLQGRSKVLATENEGDVVRAWRGRLPLLNNKSTQIVLRGPTLTPQAGHKNKVILQWPFSITIPEHVDRTGFPPDGGWGVEDAFIPPAQQPETIAEILPASFTSHSVNGNVAIEAFVEYYLTAHLPMQEGVKTARLAKLPIRIQHISPRGRCTIDEHLRAQTHNVSVSSQRLLPEKSNVEPSMADRIRAKLGGKGPEHAPKLSLSIQVKVPTVLQLDRRDTFPVLIRVTPVWEETDERIRDVPQNIKINGMQLYIVSITETTAEQGRMDKGEALIELPWQATMGPCEFPLLSTGVGEKFSYGEVDAGAWLKFRISKQLSGKAWHESLNPTSPDFVTYNIRHSHQLRYQFALDVAGQWITIKGVEDLMILPPGQAS